MAQKKKTVKKTTVKSAVQNPSKKGVKRKTAAPTTKAATEKKAKTAARVTTAPPKAAQRPPLSPKRRFLFRVIYIVFIALFLEGTSVIALIFLKETNGLNEPGDFSLNLNQKKMLRKLLDNKTEYISHDTTIGWTIKPNGASPDGLYEANSVGMRAKREYRSAANTRTRIACYGDSFTHCDEVKNGDTWEDALERQSPRLEVLNLGVPAYGPDQALLRFRRENYKYHPKIIFIGFMTENVYRCVNVYRPFYVPGTAMPLTKPRFMLQGENLKLLPNPIPKLSGYEALLTNPNETLEAIGANDYFFHKDRPKQPQGVLYTGRLASLLVEQATQEDTIIKNGYYNPNHQAYKIAMKILNTFYLESRWAGAQPVILVFPERHDMVRYGKDQTRVYEPIIKDFKQRRMAHIDLLAAFSKSGIDDLGKYFVETHYSREANEIVAAALIAYMKKNNLIN